MQTYTSPTPIPHPRHFDPHGANARLDVPLGEIPVPYDSLPPLSILAVGILGSQHGDVHLNRLGQEPLGSLP